MSLAQGHTCSLRQTIATLQPRSILRASCLRSVPLPNSCFNQSVILSDPGKHRITRWNGFLLALLMSCGDITVAVMQDLNGSLSLFGFLNFVPFAVGVDNCPDHASAALAVALAFKASKEVSARSHQLRLRTKFPAYAISGQIE